MNFHPMPRILLFVAVSSCVLNGSMASAQAVREWDLGKLQLHRQTESDTQPTTPFEYNFSGIVNTDTPGYFDTVTLENAPGGTLSYFSSTPLPSADWFFEVIESDQAVLDAAYPNQSYDIEATGPGGVDFTETIDLGFAGGGFPNEVPYFTGATFNQLQSVLAGQDQTLTWNAPPADGFAFFLIDLATDEEIFFTSNIEAFGADSPPADTMSFTIPANTLTPGSDYQAALIFANTKTDANDPSGFPTGDGFAFFGNYTELNFSISAVPEPSTVLLLSLGSIGIFSRRRR